MSYGLKNASTIKAYQDAIFMYQYLLNNNQAKFEDSDFPLLLRSFYWYSQNPPFEDVLNAAKAAMPVMGAYLIYKSRNEGLALDSYPLDEVNDSMSLLGAYLDHSEFTLLDHKNSADVVRSPFYAMEDVSNIPNLLQSDTVIIEKEKQLKETAGKELALILAKTPKERLEILNEAFTSIIACNNCLYNIIRSKGKKMIAAIKSNIYKLHYADQDFILHGLDAFPKNQDVLAFYEEFLQKNQSEHLKKQVEKYYQRVKSGMKTTGWETD